jgi:hypothetical protein
MLLTLLLMMPSLVRRASSFWQRKTLLLNMQKLRLDFLKLFYSRWLMVCWDLLQIHSTAGLFGKLIRVHK